MPLSKEGKEMVGGRGKGREAGPAFVPVSLFLVDWHRKIPSDFPIQSADPKTVFSVVNVVSSSASAGGTLVHVLGHLFCFLGSDRNILALPTCPSLL